MTLTAAIRTLRANILTARETVAAIEAQGLSAPERSRAITKAGPRGYTDVLAAMESGTDGLSEEILDAAYEAAEACSGLGWRSSAAVARFVELTAAV